MQREAIIAGVFTVVGVVLTLIGNALYGAWSEGERRQDSELQAYTNNVGELLTDDNGSKLSNDPGNPTNALISAKTVGLVERLDPRRRANVIGLLHDTSLIRLTDISSDCTTPVDPTVKSPVILHRARLDGIGLSNSGLKAINLSQTYLSQADFNYNSMPQSNLYYSVLYRANLSNGNFKCANLSWSNLQLANLRDSDLSYSDLRCSDLRGASLYGATVNDANLEEVLNLTQDQVNQTKGNEKTKLPKGLSTPEAWRIEPQVYTPTKTCAELSGEQPPVPNKTE